MAFASPIHRSRVGRSLSGAGSDSPAFSYDRNPNSIAVGDWTLTLPVAPTVAATPTCLPKASIGILKNGVVVFGPVDERNRDAAAYETQDQCDGHAQQSSTYHYHDIPSCALAASKGASTVVVTTYHYSATCEFPYFIGCYRATPG